MEDKTWEPIKVKNDYTARRLYAKGGTPFKIPAGLENLFLDQIGTIIPNNKLVMPDLINSQISSPISNYNNTTRQ